MENTTSETKDTTSLAAAPKSKGRRKMRRTASGIMAMALALTGAGFLANALTPDAQTATAVSYTHLTLPTTQQLC